ncbi:transposase, partial [Streptomyces diacarni]
MANAGTHDGTRRSGPLQTVRCGLGGVFNGSWVVDHGRVIRRHELSDAEWEFVRPLLPASLRGRKRLDDRRVLNGIVWKFRTGTAWRDVPERYGPWQTL